MKQSKKWLIFFSSLAIFFLSVTDFAFAQEKPYDPKKPIELVNPIGGSIEKPFGVTDPQKIVGGVLKKVLGILGSLALLVFVYGGFEWVTAAGNSEKVTKGTDAMTWAVVGICIIFSSYAIIDLVFQGLGTVVNKTPSYEAKEGQVWCLDAQSLCMAVNKDNCTTAKIYPTYEECSKDLGQSVGGWCLSEDGNKCEEKLAYECNPTMFRETENECKKIKEFITGDF